MYPWLGDISVSRVCLRNVPKKAILNGLVLTPLVKSIFYCIENNKLYRPSELLCKKDTYLVNFLSTTAFVRAALTVLEKENATNFLSGLQFLFNLTVDCGALENCSIPAGRNSMLSLLGKLGQNSRLSIEMGLDWVSAIRRVTRPTLINDVYSSSPPVWMEDWWFILSSVLSTSHVPTRLAAQVTAIAQPIFPTSPGLLL